MQWQLWCAILDVLEHTGIGDDQPIRAHLADGLDILIQLVDVFIMGKQVQRQIGAPSVCMAKRYAFNHLFQGELGFCAQGHIRRAQIDGVSPVENGELELAQVACGHQEFRAMLGGGRGADHRFHTLHQDWKTRL